MVGMGVDSSGFARASRVRFRRLGKELDAGETRRGPRGIFSRLGVLDREAARALFARGDLDGRKKYHAAGRSGLEFRRFPLKSDRAGGIRRRNCDLQVNHPREKIPSNVSSDLRLGGDERRLRGAQKGQLCSRRTGNLAARSLTELLP